MLSRAPILLLALSITLSSCGGGGGSSSNPAPTPSNIAPVSTDIDDQTALIGTLFSFDFQSSFSDANGDNLTYSVSYSPNANGLTDNGSVISGTPVDAQTTTITISASDGRGGTSPSQSFTITSSAPPPVSTQPNILLIISDDQGQDSSAQYSWTPDIPDTPRINNLANSGVIFENMWSNPICGPTRAALLTGKYGYHTGVTANGTLDQSETVIHEYIKGHSLTQNYATALIGKWHLNAGNSNTALDNIDYYVGFNGGGVNDYYDWTLNNNGTLEPVTDYITTRLTSEAIDWIEGQSNPWFLMLAYNTPHTPFHVPPTTLQSRVTSDTDSNRNKYLAAIEALDSEIGRLIDSFDTAELSNTIILYMGDNGTPRSVDIANDLLSGAKGDLLEGGIRVPFFVTGAGVSRTGARDATILNNTDLFATIGQLAGNPTSSIHNSQSFVSLLSLENSGTRQSVYSEFSDEGWTIRNSQYKLSEDINNVQTLIDLSIDISETTNVIGSNDIDDQGALAQLRSDAESIRN